MAPFLKRTHTPRVLDGFGGFASLFSLDYNSRLFAKNYRHPVLVACTDGVGSKLKIAALMNKHDTVGIDLVAMSVNDCLCTGGEPLMFLDYLAMPKDDPALTRDLVKGISDGCMEADCALVGGETAILPDFYQPGDYDMAGFCVGVVEREHIINGRGHPARRCGARPGQHRPAFQRLQPGPQNRLRTCRPEDRRLRPRAGPNGRRGAAGADTHLRPADQEYSLQHYPVKSRVVRGLAHITGEGLPGNVPRILPPGRRVLLASAAAGRVPPVFPWLQRLGRHRPSRDGPRLQHGHRLRDDRQPRIYAESIQRQLAEDRVKS